MYYEIEKLSPKALKIIFLVLDHIKIKSELRKRKRWLFCKAGKIRGVSAEDQEVIIRKLVKSKILSENVFWSIFSEQDVVNISEEFFDFHKKVSDQLNQAGIKKEKVESKSKPSHFKGLIWEDITLRFLNEYDVEIAFKNQKIKSDYLVMGFADKRKNAGTETKAKESWKMLQLFAANQNVFPIDNLTGKEKEKRKKQKQELSKLLRLYFDIQEDPISFSEVNNNYKICLNLIPEETFVDQWEDRNIIDENML
jgi:hypothetical protein